MAIGARIRFDPSIVVTHAHRTDIGAFLAHQARIGAANARVVRAIGLQGKTIASHRWAATALLPALATYRFARTVAACWTQERCLLLRNPAVAGLCWLGMLAWGVGFARPAELTLHRSAWRPMMPTQIVHLDLRAAPTVIRLRDDIGAVLVLVTADGRPVALRRLPRPADGLLSSVDVLDANRADIGDSVATAPVRALAPVSVVVPTRERPDDLARCLASLAGIEADGHEVIVVDSGPATNRTMAVAERFGVRYLVEPRPGANRARNAGLAAASRDIVAFVDDDVVVSPTWLAAISRELRGSARWVRNRPGVAARARNRGTGRLRAVLPASARPAAACLFTLRAAIISGGHRRDGREHGVQAEPADHARRLR